MYLIKVDSFEKDINGRHYFPKKIINTFILAIATATKLTTTSTMKTIRYDTFRQEVVFYSTMFHFRPAVPNLFLLAYPQAEQNKTHVPPIEH